MSNLTIEEKLKNLPRIYVTSAEKNECRREVLRSHFYSFGIENYSFFITTPEQDSKREITGDKTDKLDPRMHLVTAAYLEAIRHWYETTDEEYALFLEDDIWFETARYWNFTWSDFVNHLPKDWGCVHLGSIWHMHPSWSYTQLSNEIVKSSSTDSALMSLIKRPYAKKLIDQYIKGNNKYDFTPPTIPNENREVLPWCETIVYMSFEGSYRFLLLTENPYYGVYSTFRPNDYTLYYPDCDLSEPVSKAASRFNKAVITWWEKIGSRMTIQELMLSPFDWGNLDGTMRMIINKEVFEDRIYEKHKEVKPGDIVVDIGANCGAFTYSILKKEPSKVYCVEPSNGLMQPLLKNTKHGNVSITNKGIGKETTSNYNCVTTSENGIRMWVFSHEGESCDMISFKDFITNNNIDHIDFLKFDCEGGEYYIFTEENEDYIKNNVSYAAGEWHFQRKDGSDFINFRDRYLLSAKFFRVYDRWDNDLTDSILDNSFVKDFHDRLAMTDYCQVMIYVSWK